MRTSDYTIHVPLPDGDHVLIHGYSGAVDRVGKEVADILLFAQKDNDFEQMPQETIDILKKRGYLTERTPEQERDTVRKVGRLYYQAQKKNAGFLIMPTYDCNLRCFYCYEKRLRAKGPAWLEKTISRAEVDAAFDAMAQVRQDLGFDDAAIDAVPNELKAITLYGGEPFLKRNAEIVYYIVEKGLSLGYRCTAVTNGSELDGFLDLLGEDKVFRMQITLDGPPRMHDKRRFMAGGKGSFDAIARNITEALERGVYITVRTNVDQRNVDGIAELSDIYIERGWTDYPNFMAYCNAVHLRPDAKGQESLFSTAELIQRLETDTNEYPQIQIATTDFYFNKKFTQLLRGERYPQLSPVFCGSHVGMYLFDPHGDVYACWDSVGEPIGKVGRYLPEMSLDQEALSQWRERTVMSIPECVACKYALLCGGGCAQHAYYETGALKNPYCEDFGDLFRAAVPAAYQAYVSSLQKDQAQSACACP